MTHEVTGSWADTTVESWIFLVCQSNEMQFKISFCLLRSVKIAKKKKSFH